MLITHEHKKKTQLKITRLENNEGKREDSKRDHSPIFKFPANSGQAYTYNIKNMSSIKAIEAFPIYINTGDTAKDEVYFIALGNRKGGYPLTLRKQLSTVVHTFNLLVANYKTKERLQTTEKLLEQFVNYVPAAAAIFDKDMRYLMVSRKWVNQEMGLPTVDLKNKSHYEIVKDIPERWRKIHQQCLKGTSLKCEDDKFIRSDGSIQWLRWAIRPWYKRTQVGGLLMFLEHTTEAKKSEEDLRAIIKDLEESKAQIERFAYTCSHDLKEPLRTIYTFLQLIKNESTHFAAPQISKYFDFIFEGIQRMRDLIENLLLHSELGSKNLHLETFSLSEIIETVIKNNAHYILESNASISITKDCKIYADKFLITQVIHNLVSNAFKYTRNTASYIEIGGTENESNVEIYVKDNGIGINKLYYKNIFYEFKKINNNDYTSNGIGLAICKNIVEKHQGKIWLTSEEGKGSTFFFTLSTKLNNEVNPLNYKGCNLLQHKEDRA